MRIIKSHNMVIYMWGKIALWNVKLVERIKMIRIDFGPPNLL